MLKTPLKIVLAVSIAVPAMLVTNLAQARNNKHNQSYNSHHSKNYNQGRHGYKYGRQGYKYGHYYSPPRVYYYPPQRYYYGGYYGGHYSKAGTYAGLAILGATLGYVLYKSNQNNNRYQAPPPRQNTYVPPQSNYSQPQQDGFDFSQCRETRDYETTIFIDGQEAAAYGTACLMADGTWVAGPMRVGR